MENHGAIIQVDIKTFLKMLDFKDGIIHNIKKNDEVWQPGILEMVLEHPDLPLVRDGDYLQKITPTYLMRQGENGVIIEIERTDPPKKRGKSKSKEGK